MIIPKNTKLKNTIWKNYTLLDFLLALGAIGIVSLIALSKFKGKWQVCIIFLIAVVVMFIPLGNEQIMYNEALHWLKFCISPKKFHKKQKSKKDKNLVDRLIPYTAIRGDGTIVYPNYYGKVIAVGSKEFDLEDDYEQDIDIMSMSKIFQCLDISQTLDLVKIDRPIIFDKYIYGVIKHLEALGYTTEQAIEEEKENVIEQLAKLGNENIDKIKQQILITRFKQLDFLNTQEKQFRPFYYYVVYDSSIQALKDTVASMCEILNGIELPCEVLRQKDVAIFLKYCNTRNFDEREIEALEPENYLDWIKPNNITFKYNGYKIDDVEAFVVGISDYPIEVDNAWGADIMNIDDTKVVVHINPVAQPKAVSRIDKVVNELFSREDTLHKASQQLDQSTHLDTMRELLVSLQNNNESFADVSITITGFNYQNQDYTSFRKKVRNEITTKGFTVDPLWYRQLDGLITSNISKLGALKHVTRGIQSTALGALFPFVNTAILEENGIMLGNNNYPVIFDIWKWKYNNAFQNANAMIIGTAGSGKSYYMKMLITNLFAEGCISFILDPENEYVFMARKCGGAVVDVGNATEGRLNPFHIYQILTENGETADPQTVFYSHLRTLDSFLHIVLQGIGSDCMEMLNNLIVEVYKQKGISADTDVKNFSAEQFPTFDDLIKIVENKKTQEKNELLKQDYIKIESYVKKFAKGGRYSDIWNAPSTLVANDILTVFNFQSLFASKNNVVANAQMLLVFRFLEQEIINIRESNKTNSIQHVCVVADEAHMFIDPKYTISLDFFYQMAKRIRKYDGAFIVATQSISDWTANEELASKTTAIIKNSQYNFIFKLNPSDIEDLVDVYRSGASINEVEQHRISNGKTGEVFFIGSTKQRASFKIVAPTEVESLFQANNNADENIEEDDDFWEDELEEKTKMQKRQEKKLKKIKKAEDKKKTVKNVAPKAEERCAEDVAPKAEERCADDVAPKAEERCADDVAPKAEERCADDVAPKAEERCADDVAPKKELSKFEEQILRAKEHAKLFNEQEAITIMGKENGKHKKK